MSILVDKIARFIQSIRRPSKATNIRLLRERGETTRSYGIREANSHDIPKLAILHVKTWNETYRNVKNPPTVQVRENQWREQFKVTDVNWFCYVVEDPYGELVGFAKGKVYKHSDLPNFSGELNKIYLLSQFQRIGLGRRLICQVVRRFLNDGISSMVLFSVPQNPSCAFFEALGGKRLPDKNERFQGSYGWEDLKEIATTCSIEQVSKMEFYNNPLKVDEYEKMCAEYDGTELYRILNIHLAPNSTLLELGCGLGLDIEQLKDSYNITGSDLSDEFLLRCRQKFLDIPFLKLDAVSIQTDNNFDCIFSNKVLHHLNINELEKSLIRQKELIAKNGIFAHTFWLGDKEFEMEGLLFVYHNRDKLINMISSYFTILESFDYKEFEDGDSIFIIAKNNKSV